jgi:hypothetical protein
VVVVVVVVVEEGRRVGSGQEAATHATPTRPAALSPLPTGCQLSYAIVSSTVISRLPSLNQAVSGETRHHSSWRVCFLLPPY